MSVCEISAPAGDGGVQVFGIRVVDDADDGLALDGETEGDADVGIEVDKVGRAVDRVDDECWCCGNEGWRWRWRWR